MTRVTASTKHCAGFREVECILPSEKISLHGVAITNWFESSFHLLLAREETVRVFQHTEVMKVEKI